MIDIEKETLDLINKQDFAIIDCPYNNTNDYKEIEGLWNNFSIFDIFQKIDVSALYVWCNYKLLPKMISAYIESEYEYRGCIPWVKTSEEDYYENVRTLKSCSDFLLVFQKSNCNLLRPYNYIIIEDNHNKRPIKWIDSMIQKFNDEQANGIYIYAKGTYKLLPSKEAIYEQSVKSVNLWGLNE